jgi:hypothetical protein
MVRSSTYVLLLLGRDYYSTRLAVSHGGTTKNIIHIASLSLSEEVTQ